MNGIHPSFTHAGNVPAVAGKFLTFSPSNASACEESIKNGARPSAVEKIFRTFG
jgi:hypothetical protein